MDLAIKESLGPGTSPLPHPPLHPPPAPTTTTHSLVIQQQQQQQQLMLMLLLLLLLLLNHNLYNSCFTTTTGRYHIEIPFAKDHETLPSIIKFHFNKSKRFSTKGQEEAGGDAPPPGHYTIQQKGLFSTMMMEAVERASVAKDKQYKVGRGRRRRESNGSKAIME